MFVASLVAMTLSLSPPTGDVETEPPAETTPPTETPAEEPGPLPTDAEPTEPVDELPSVVEPEPPRATDFPGALDQVRAAQDLANEDPRAGAVRLSSALDQLETFVLELANDDEGQRARALARLILARTLLAIDDGVGARAAMDEALRTSLGDPLPIDEFGPGVRALHQERVDALTSAGTGEIVVDCHQPCQVYLNERPIDREAGQLPVGTYRLHVEAVDAQRDDQPSELSHEITVESGRVARVEFGLPPPVSDVPKRPTRILPRAAEISMLAIGIGALAAGAALWAINGSCPGLGDPVASQCPHVYETRAAGIIAVGTGGVLAILGGVTLAIDEVRVGQQRGRSASLVWSLRF